MAQGVLRRRGGVFIRTSRNRGSYARPEHLPHDMFPRRRRWNTVRQLGHKYTYRLRGWMPGYSRQ